MTIDQALRWWRLAPWSRNPLMRGTDRVDSVVAAVLIAFVLIVVPFAAAFGTVTYTGLAERSHAELQTRHAQSAVLVEDPRPVVVADAHSRSPDTQDRATAQWTAPDGTLRSTDVQTAPGTHRGDTVTVWVDTNGNIVAEPRSGMQNAAIAVSAALSVWAGAAVGALLLYSGVRWISGRSRMRQWDREWNDLGRTPGWPVS
ncbi:hypothetical protein [Rhodococcus jostii]|uniref:Rv1733c family protein n=1 Tax=Rhodococcus jostii TaxID=132919 RepID=UPI00365AF302